MPTKKPRLMLSVSAELLHDLETLALATRKPVATVATELLHDLRPRMLDVAREISAITLDRGRAAQIEARIANSTEGQQQGLRFTVPVRVTGVELPSVSHAKKSPSRARKRRAPK
jgi:hypothetical protein